MTLKLNGRYTLYCINLYVCLTEPIEHAIGKKILLTDYSFCHFKCAYSQGFWREGAPDIVRCSKTTIFSAFGHLYCMISTFRAKAEIIN